MAQSIELRYQPPQPDQPAASVRIERREDVYYVTLPGHEQPLAVRVDEVTPDSISFSVEGRAPRDHARRAYVVTDGSRRFVALDGIDGHVYALTQASESRGSRRKTSANAGDEGLTATMPGQVVNVLVAPGESVTRGQPLLVLEAMKMELRVTAPHDGQVTRVLCERGQVVERGQLLLELAGA